MVLQNNEIKLNSKWNKCAVREMNLALQELGFKGLSFYYLCTRDRIEMVKLFLEN